MATLLYKEDFYAWTQQVAQSLRAGTIEPAQFEFIAEEIEDLGKSQRRELKTRLAVLMAHLLKMRFQPERSSRSWENTIAIQRDEIRDLLEENPSLRPEIAQVQAKAYRKAALMAEAETELPKGTFPPLCPFVIDEILNDKET